MFSEKNGYHLQILEEKEKHRKEVENAKIIAKNSANETISQLNKQIVSERAKMFSEQQEMKKRMEEEFRMKENRLQQSLACLEESLTLVEVRERGWQQEREEILQEVQREVPKERSAQFFWAWPRTLSISTASATLTACGPDDSVKVVEPNLRPLVRPGVQLLSRAKAKARRLHEGEDNSSDAIFQ